MLYEPHSLEVMDGDLLSLFLSLSRSQHADEAVRVGMFGASGQGVAGRFFEPVSGFHFGECGPVRVGMPLRSSFCCDVPALAAIVILAGEWRCSFGKTTNRVHFLRKNMFMLGDWDDVYGSSLIPSQEEYCHVAIIVEREALATHFGRAAARDIRQKLRQAICLSASDAHSLCGPASPDVLALARQLLLMRKDSPWTPCPCEGRQLTFLRALCAMPLSKKTFRSCPSMTGTRACL